MTCCPSDNHGSECRDSFVGSAQALVAPKMAPWAAAASKHLEESAADLEGGHPQESYSQPPPPPPRKPVAVREEKKKTAQVPTVRHSIVTDCGCKLRARMWLHSL